MSKLFPSDSPLGYGFNPYFTNKFIAPSYPLKEVTRWTTLIIAIVSIVFFTLVLQAFSSSDSACLGFLNHLFKDRALFPLDLANELTRPGRFDYLCQIVAGNRGLLAINISSWSATLMAAFLCAYFLPIHLKIVSMILFYWLLLIWLCPMTFVLFFIFLLSTHYLLAHPDCGHRLEKAIAYCIITTVCCSQSSSSTEIGLLLSVGVFALISGFIFKHLKSRWTLAVQTALPICIVLFCIFWNQGDYLSATDGPSGFAHWAAYFFFLNFGLRLIWHYIELRDKFVPKNLSFLDYLTQFTLMPDFFASEWWFHMGQGHSYLRDSFYKQDKNRIILKGVKNLFIGLGYILILIPVYRFSVNWICDSLGYKARSLAEVYALFASGGHYTISNLFWASVQDMMLYTSLVAGGVHIKIGLYRLFGFELQSNTYYFWFTTSLSDFWKRFGYHYMQLILRGFYLPLFLKLRTLKLRTRTYVSIFYAMFVGQALTNGSYVLDKTSSLLHLTPYFFLLAIGIGYSFNFNGRQSRKPWTIDRKLPLDLVKMSGIFIFYGVAHMFLIFDVNSGKNWTLYLILNLFRRS